MKFWQGFHNQNFFTWLQTDLSHNIAAINLSDAHTLLANFPPSQVAIICTIG